MTTLPGMRVFGICLLLVGAAACNASLVPGSDQTGTPEMLVIGGPNRVASGPAGGLDAVPPPNLDPSPMGVTPSMVRDRTGIYSGVIEPLDTGGGRCTGDRQTVTNFRVTGTNVRWQQFSGQITGNGLQMQSGNDWLIGEFIDGTQFSGRIGSTGPNQPPGCTWRIRLAKTGI